MTKSDGKRPLGHTLLAGGIAGFVESSVCHPLDTVKTRMQLRNNHIESVSTRLKHSLVEPALIHLQHSLVDPGLRMKDSAMEAGLRMKNSLVEPANLVPLRRYPPAKPSLANQNSLQRLCGSLESTRVKSRNEMRENSAIRNSDVMNTSRDRTNNNNGSELRNFANRSNRSATASKLPASQSASSTTGCWWRNDIRVSERSNAIGNRRNLAPSTETNDTKSVLQSKTASSKFWWNRSNDHPLKKNGEPTINTYRTGRPVVNPSPTQKNSFDRTTSSASWRNSKARRALPSNFRSCWQSAHQSKVYERRIHTRWIGQTSQPRIPKGPLGPIQTARKIIQNEGVLSLYKGLSAVYAGIIPKMAIRFVSFEQYKDMLKLHSSLGERTSNFTAGLLTGLTEAILIVTPAEVCKIRMQSQKHSMLDPTDIKKCKYGNVVQTAVTIVREEGANALYKGVVPTMLRQGCNQAVNFTVYNAMKSYWIERQRQRYVLERGKIVSEDYKQLSGKMSLLIGGMSGAMGPIANNPLDVVKTRLQKQKFSKNGGSEPKYTGLVQACLKISSEEGAGALWKGITPRLMRIVPGQAITFTTYEAVCRWLL